MCSLVPRWIGPRALSQSITKTNIPVKSKQRHENMCMPNLTMENGKKGTKLKKNNICSVCLFGFNEITVYNAHRVGCAKNPQHREIEVEDLNYDQTYEQKLKNTEKPQREESPQPSMSKGKKNGPQRKTPSDDGGLRQLKRN